MATRRAASERSPKAGRSGTAARARQDHSQELAQDYVELIADLIGQQGEARVVDVARGLGVDLPTAVQCTGAKLEFTGDIQETPDTQIATFTFPESNAVLVYEQRLWSPYFQEGHENGVAFYGTDGYMVIGRRGWKVVEKRNKVLIDKQVEFSDVPHLENFLDGIKTGAALNCEVEEGYRSTLLAHLGNLAFRVGRPLKFDRETHTIAGDAEANALIKRLGRKEFQIPEQI